MMTPVIPFSFQFTTDGTSTALSFDLATAPTNLDLRGAQITGVQNLTMGAVGIVGGVAGNHGVTASVVGTVITLTFSLVMTQLDTNSDLVVYTCSGLLQVAGLPLSTTL